MLRLRNGCDQIRAIFDTQSGGVEAHVVVGVVAPFTIGVVLVVHTALLVLVVQSALGTVLIGTVDLYDELGTPFLG